MTELIYASTREADLRYVIRMEVSDPVFWLSSGGKEYIFLDHREIDIFKGGNQSQELEAVLVNPLVKECGGGAARLATLILQRYAPEEKEIVVPRSFPLDVADVLRDNGFAVEVRHPFLPSRKIKTGGEISSIKSTILRTGAAFRRIEAILQEAVLKGRELVWEDAPLTSETLKAEAEIALIREGLADVEGMIIACEAHSAIPHHRGSGPVYANEPIVCDIFPRDRVSGYHADVTRTYVKGRPSARLQKLYDAVLLAQEKAIAAVRPGVAARDVHAVAARTLEEEGFHVGDQGFTHATGHGLGLDVHEHPHVGATSSEILEAGNVITVEPGLYYPDIGGVRIEDVILVTENGAENLARIPKRFVID